MANRKHCGHCGEKITPAQAMKFDTRHKDVAYHEACFWGRAIEHGWSYLAQPGHRPPSSLALPCMACTLTLTLGVQPVWYERWEDRYVAYHPECSPSRILD